MKKYNTIALNLLKVETENILGASAIVSGGQAQSGGDGGVVGGNGGDGNARQAGSSLTGVSTNWDADL